MRSYHQYCPIALAAEVLGDRWTLRIVRELSRPPAPAAPAGAWS